MIEDWCAQLFCGNEYVGAIRILWADSSYTLTDDRTVRVKPIPDLTLEPCFSWDDKGMFIVTVREVEEIEPRSWGPLLPDFY